MAPAKYSSLNLLVQRLAASRPGAWFFAPLLHHLDAFALRLSRRRVSVSGMLAGVPTVVLTCTGAKSGKARTLTLLRVDDPDRPGVFGVIASNWGRAPHPAWYHNLTADPRAVCAFDGRTANYRAHEAGGTEYDRFWKAALAIYGGYLGYKQRIRTRNIPIMVLEPAP